jgi:hypothetical protein
MTSYLPHAARLLFGIEFLLNGLNWWWKILPFPSMSDPLINQGPPFVQAMIKTGYMFDGIKIIEVVAGSLLLVNRYVPLALVVAFPVSVGAWSVDFFLIPGSLRAQVMGWSVLLLNTYLLLAYLPYFKTMLVARAPLVESPRPTSGAPLHWSTVVVGLVAVTFGLVACGWLFVLAKQVLLQSP